MGHKGTPLPPGSDGLDHEDRLRLHKRGFERGMNDWEDEVYIDPYLEETDSLSQVERAALSAGWGDGQDRMFRWSADEFDEIAKRDSAILT